MTGLVECRQAAKEGLTHRSECRKLMFRILRAGARAAPSEPRMSCTVNATVDSSLHASKLGFRS